MKPQRTPQHLFSAEERIKAAERLADIATLGSSHRESKNILAAAIACAAIIGKPLHPKEIVRWHEANVPVSPVIDDE